MYRIIGLFVLSFLVGFSGVYLFTGNEKQADSTNTAVVEEQQDQTQTDDAEHTTEHMTEQHDQPAVSNVKTGGEIFVQAGCVQCHSVSAYDVKGGQTGPDLSNAYAEVLAKHGKSLDEFLKEPTTAVMSSVIKGKPLSDEELNKIVEALKTISEK
ncbi:MAG: hypothetical protein BAA01_05230 [Bacillus thermozeamaize]|uniref:Cytochrome c domain-containing protein n=1 Tax=Bacillus thermozeamaize TaxID=230954 RepID=A0A1Y3PQW5_9BACI|nr:MAG: hypothetical protein BAA01_05230 [Bacillus thermozeamaize]